MSPDRSDDHGVHNVMDLLDSFSDFDRSVRIPWQGELRCPHCGSLRRPGEYQFPHAPGCVMLTLLTKRLVHKEPRP